MAAVSWLCLAIVVSPGSADRDKTGLGISHRVSTHFVSYKVCLGGKYVSKNCLCLFGIDLSIQTTTLLFLSLLLLLFDSQLVIKRLTSLSIYPGSFSV